MLPIVRAAVLGALAVLAFAPVPEAAAAAQTTTVKIHNARSGKIYVAYTAPDQKPGAITWGKGCQKLKGGVAIARGKTCTATVVNNDEATRFCADTKSVPKNCYQAQTRHQTMVETNFQPSTASGCFGKGRCVWYDISVIPANCTDAAWAKNRCAGTGGASYNLPVSVACGGTTEYTCRGPQTTKYGSARYPAKCGNPDATCSGGNDPKCLNAYFYPMSGMNPQPNTVCLSGKPLTIRFLGGA